MVTAVIHGLATGPPSGDMCPVPPPVSDSLLVLPSKAHVLVRPHPGTQDSRPISPAGPLQPPSITCPVTCPQSPAGDELSGLRLFLLSVLPLVSTPPGRTGSALVRPSTHRPRCSSDGPATSSRLREPQPGQRNFRGLFSSHPGSRALPPHNRHLIC